MRAERHWLCWSFQQAMPHIESEAEGVRKNLRAFQANRPVDFVPIAVFHSHDEAMAFASTLHDAMARRQEAKADAQEATCN